MTNSNRIKLTWISFFSYALTGALVIVTGMVMGNIADYFHLPVSSMSNTFTFLNAGILISIFLNAWLMEIVPLKTQLRFGFILMVLAVTGLMLSHSLALFSASMFVLGLVSGITMSIGTFLITHMYEGRQRGARLLFTDSFFSMAGMIFPMVAAVLLARSIEWYWVYACIGLVYVAIFVLTFGCDFPVLGKKAQSDRAVSRSNNQDRAVHLRSTGDHVFNIVGVARAVYVRVVASRGVVFNVRGVDGDTTSFFFRRVIDLVECASGTTVGFSQNGSDGSSQGSFTMVNVADSTNVDVRFCTFKFFFRHGYIPYYSALPFGESTGLRF